MKKNFLLLLLYFTAISSLYATTFENGDSGDTSNWAIYDNTPENASISNLIDDSKHGKVIELLGDNLNNGFQIGGFPSQTKAWTHSDEKVLGFDIKTSEKFLIFISLETVHGFKFLIYAPTSSNIGSAYGLGVDTKNGKWHTIYRDLEADLKEIDPTNSILTVNGLFFRGSARMDNIELINEIPSLPSLPPVAIPKEFRVYDNTPTGATVTTVTDELKGEVVMLKGDGTKNGYGLGGVFNSTFSWNETNKTKLSWSMKYNETFLIFVRVNTTKGHKYLIYAPTDYDTGSLHGLGSSAMDDTWRDFNRDLVADLADVDPTNELLSVNGFFIRGSGLILNPQLIDPAPLPTCNRGVDDELRAAIKVDIAEEYTSDVASALEFVSIDELSPLAHYPQEGDYSFYYLKASFDGMPEWYILRVNCSDHTQIDYMYTMDNYNLIFPAEYIGTINGVSFYPVYSDNGAYPNIVGFSQTGPTKSLGISMYQPEIMIVEGDHIIIEDYDYYNGKRRSVYDENGTLLSRVAI